MNVIHLILEEITQKRSNLLLTTELITKDLKHEMKSIQMINNNPYKRQPNQNKNLR